MTIKLCPCGHESIDFVDLGHRWYVYCYDCKKKYFVEDYIKRFEESYEEEKAK